MSKRYKYTIPVHLMKNQEAIDAMTIKVKELNSRRTITPSDEPLLNSLATSFDLYWSATKDILLNGMTQVNKKGEEVKSPMVGIRKEEHLRILEILREFFLTEKSASKGQAPKKNNEDNSPIKKFLP